MRTTILFGVLAVSILFCNSESAFAQPECAPCDVTMSECQQVEGTELRLHPCVGTVACFKFYRRACGGSTWTLIYEGPDNVYCDPEYTVGSCVQYKGERWTEIDEDKCAGSKQCDSVTICPSGC